jgi:hypothetical protein
VCGGGGGGGRGVHFMAGLYIAGSHSKTVHLSELRENILYMEAADACSMMNCTERHL